MRTAFSSTRHPRSADLAPAGPWSMQPLKWIGSVLGRSKPAPRPPTSKKREASSGQGGGEALRLDHAALSALLDRHAASRDTMRHLAFIEHKLARQGSRAFRDMPVPVMSKGLEQLATLAQDESAMAFSVLRSRLTMAIALRSSSAPARDATPAVDVADVSEASHSLFDEMERSWTGQMPTPAQPG